MPFLQGGGTSGLPIPSAPLGDLSVRMALRERMESTRFLLLPAELQVMLAGTMDSGARIADWVSVFNTSDVFAQGVVETAFRDWVAGQPLGSSFGEFGNAEAEVQFVKDHIACKDIDGGYLAALITL
jgi:hypothetical protein